MYDFRTKIGLIWGQWDLDHWNLYDSHQNFLGTIYCEKEELEDLLKQVNHPADLQKIGAIEGCFYAQSLDELLKVINEAILDNNLRYDIHEPLFTKEEIQTNEWLNKVGNWYIWVFDGTTF